MEDWSWTICRGFVVRIRNAQITGHGGAKTCRSATITDQTSSGECCVVAPARRGFQSGKARPLFGANLPEEKVAVVLGHVAEGCGVRKTSRLTGVHKDTVTRYSRLAGGHAKQLHDELVAVSPRNTRGSVRRKVVVREQKGKTLRSGESG